MESNAARLFHPLFIIRRMVFSMSLMFLGEYPSLQVGIFIYSSLLQVIYIGLVKPYEEKFKNNLELLNEFTVLIVSMMLPVFTDYMEQTQEVQYSLGWIALGLILLQCLFNFGVQAVTIFRNIRNYFRKRKAELLLKKRMQSAKVYDIRSISQLSFLNLINQSNTSLIKESPKSS